MSEQESLLDAPKWRWPPGNQTTVAQRDYREDVTPLDSKAVIGPGHTLRTVRIIVYCPTCLCPDVDFPGVGKVGFYKDTVGWKRIPRETWNLRNGICRNCGRKVSVDLVITHPENTEVSETTQ